MHAMSKLAIEGDAPVNLVSDKIQYLLENKVERLRHPVGPDSLVFFGLRATVSDERLIEIFGQLSDEDFVAHYKQETSIDLTPYL